MADSVDRIFVHALNTVKKIPKTGAARPPASERMRLYGLYKQALEGDVAGVMERPIPLYGSNSATDDVQREQEKWDAWSAQSGMSKTEAKRRYIETLIETMHTYATTPQAVELVAELEFVWNQVKDQSGSSSNKSPNARANTQTDATDVMRILRPMSEQDEDAEEDFRREIADDEGSEQGTGRRKSERWAKRMERAMVRLSIEMAALREQVQASQAARAKRRRTLQAWVKWLFWMALKHVVADALMLGALLLWLKRKRHRRFEYHVRGALQLGRESARSWLPARQRIRGS